MSDASGGSYLSPEPLLESPDYVREMIETGMTVPVYGYAASNPNRFVDPPGLATENSPDGPTGGYRPGAGPAGAGAGPGAVPRPGGGPAPRRGPGPSGGPGPTQRRWLPNGCPSDRPILFLRVPSSTGGPPHSLCIHEEEDRQLRDDCDRLQLCLDHATSAQRTFPVYAAEIRNACKMTFRCLLGFC